jgi:hypothetical protein
MALLRRRKRPDAQDQGAPAASASAPAPAAAPGETSWRPQTAQFERPKERPSTPGDWVPGGLQPRPHRSRSGVHARPAALDATAAGAAADPPATAAPPVLGDDELRGRIDQLEQQIAAAERAEAEKHRSGHAPTAAEEAAAADSYAQLQRALVDLRARVDRQSGTQQETIESLEARLASFEQQLERPRFAGAATRTATALRLAILIAVFIVIAGAPLFTTRRTTCTVDQKKEISWSFVAPFDNGGPPQCKNELGGTVVLDAVGLR